MSYIFDTNSEKYDSWYEKNKYFYMSELEAVRRVLPKAGTGLEIGVGTGRFAGPLDIRHGIDISANMLKKAKSRGIKIKKAAAERLPYKDKAFDYAVMIVTICFVKDPLKSLKEAHRVLKPGGKLILGLVERNSRLGKKYMKSKSLFYKHAVFFTFRDVEKLLIAAGFKVKNLYQTLISDCEKKQKVEKPLRGRGRGSFTVICAEKTEK